MSAALSSAAGMQNGFDPSRVDDLNEREREIVMRRQALLGPGYKLMYDHPVEFVRGSDVYLYDLEENAYLDCYNNVCSVGHCNPRVVEAVSRQLNTLNTHTRYMSEDILTFSEKLLKTFEPELNRVMYACSGSEAVDLALRTAKFYTGGTGIIITDYAYHGTTASVAAISPTMGETTPIDMCARTVPAPYAYREPNEIDVGLKFSEDIQKAINDMKRHGIKFAGFIADSIFSTDGLLTEPKGFLKNAIEVVHRNGGIYIADEVQPGWGRTGKNMWGYQNHGIVPDLVVMGKPMGNGMPISAMVARAELLQEFGTKVRYFNTFAGNPVAIAASDAVLGEIQGGLMDNCRVMGAYLLEGFKKIAESCPEHIGDVRGSGMYFAVEFVKSPVSKERDGEMARRVVSEMRERRVLISTTGKEGNCLKIRPILTFSRKNCDELLNAFEDSLRSILFTSPPQEEREDEKSLKHFSVIEPSFAKKALRDNYGFEATSVKKLSSERDQVFMMSTTNDKHRKVIIKFASPFEEAITSNFQTEIQHYLNEKDPSLPVQKVVTSLSGKLESRINCNSGVRTARVLSYIEGNMLGDVTRTPSQSYHIGQAAGRVAKALQGFTHPGSGHKLLWDIQHALDLRNYLASIPNLQQRKKLEICIENFELRVKPNLKHLRKQVIHNDYNPQNVLVDSEDPDNVVGILDFGDAVFAPLVMDVAVGAAYQLGVGETLLHGPLEFVRGYNSVVHLTNEELRVVFDLIRTRTATRIIIPSWRAEKFPENAEYLLRNIDEASTNFEALFNNIDEEGQFVLIGAN